MDKLIVKGIGALDGEYAFDPGMLELGHPESLTNREAHQLKVMSGVRLGELQDALAAGDNDVLIALAAIILTRHGKRFDEEQLWDAPMGSGLTYEFSGQVEDGDDESPPENPPLPDEPESEPSGPQPSSGGGSSTPRLVPPAPDPSPTGPQSSDTSSISAQAI